MAALSIPEQYQSGLAKIATLPNARIDELISSLKNVNPSSRSADFVSSAIEKVPDLASNEDLKSAVVTLYSLYMLRAVVRLPISRFVPDLLAAAKDSGSPTLRSAADDPDFKSKLQRLMTIDSLELSAKAFSLEREHEHLFHDAQIFTDLRPVFNKDVSAEPIGMVLAYTMKLIFHDGTRHKEFYLALDEDDIARLKKVVERAETKADTLRRLLETKQIRRMA